ncbi:MAG: hypothetical protein JNK38_06830 [Acidobacteria bacterium]|nr:hypothetical protein [Acidobacteriota bacterium]
MKGIVMAKNQEKSAQEKEEKLKKESKEKNGNALVGRVKKVVKKSRRKLGDEKFEKQLQRTIAFLEELQRKMTEAESEQTEKKAKPAKKDKTEKIGQQKKVKSKPVPKAESSSTK